MSLIRRAVLNLVRSPLRTVVITLLLAVSIGLALIMATVHGATQSQMADIRERSARRSRYGGGVLWTDGGRRAAGPGRHRQAQ